ncbi:MAG: efflux RND transporter periplasmic adaptor subunit [Desulfamplus sp.]|nr:efflux RND transporter periplasmic adaptor subunit [Desulfamplus sp.]
MNRIKFIQIISLCFILTMICIIPSNIVADEKQAESEKTKQQSATPPAKVVTAKVVDSMVAENAQILGTLFFDNMSLISTEVNGLVSSVNFRTGDVVKKDAPMVQLRTDFIQNEIESVQANISQIEARLKKAQKDLNRYSTLYRQEAASEKEFDDMTLSKEDLVKQRAILQTTLELAKLKKRKSIISAPFDGVVLEKNAESGSWVAPGTILCTLAPIDDLFVKVPVSESLLKFSPKGEKVSVTITALDKTLTGTVDGLIPIADPQTRSIFIKVKLPRVDGVVLNMSAAVSLPVGEKRNMPLVPRDALVNFNGQNMIYTIKDEKAALLPVKVVSYLGDNVAIEGQGIMAGMVIIVDGNARLRPDQSVIVINSKN